MVLSYSFHLSNDKNKSKKVKAKAKNNLSGTTSESNNAIQSHQQLSKADRHNLRKYDNNQELICTIKGSSSIVEDTKKLYLDLFEDARIKYNEKQKRNDRKIENYFNHISNDNTHDLACEIIIEIGNMYFWKNKDDTYKRKMIDVFKNQIDDLENIVPNFKIANATIHFDESSPHLHIIGVPFKDGNKNGMERQVGKSTIFTRESLRVIQDKMRVCCIESFNKTYKVNYTLKIKEEGRNEDIASKNMARHYEIKQKQEEHQKRLTELNTKKDNLIKESDDIREKISNLKQNVLNKNNYTISSEEVNEIIEFIDNAKSTTEDLKTANELTTILENYEKDILEHNDLITDLNKQITSKDSKIKRLETQNKQLKEDKKVLKSEKDELEKSNNRLVEFIEALVEQLKKFFRKLLQFDNKPTQDYAADVVKGYYNNEVFNRNDIFDIAADTPKEYELFNYANIYKKLDIEKPTKNKKDRNKDKDNDLSL